MTANLSLFAKIIVPYQIMHRKIKEDIMKTTQMFFGIIVVALLLASCSSGTDSDISSADFQGKWIYSGPPDGSNENYFIFNGNIVFNKSSSREGTWSDVGRIRFTDTEIILLEGGMWLTYSRRDNTFVYPYRFEDNYLFLSILDLRGWTEYRFTKQSDDSFSGSAKSYDDFTGKWVDLLILRNSQVQERYFEFAGDNMFFRGLETGWDQSWKGKFTFTDAKLSFISDEVVSWDAGGTTGTTGTKTEWLYWLDGNILTLSPAILNSTYLYGTYTKQ